jgi:sarcosine oxidase
MSDHGPTHGPTEQQFDAIVIGLGGMGTAATCALSRRGKRVLALEQFDLGHELGSSGAGIRIYRFAQFLDPGYVPLMRHAHQHWARLERDAGEQLLFRTGGLDIGPPNGELITGSKAACTLHNLPHEVLRAADVRLRHPAWHVPDTVEAVFQPDAGFLSAERAIFAHARLALKNNACLQFREKVLHFNERSDHVTVQTSRGRYRADKLIITAGPWAADFAPTLATRIVPERQVVGWFAPKTSEHFSKSAFPVFIVEDETGITYGFPEHDRPGFKLGRHGHRNQATTADTVERVIDEADEAVLNRTVARYFPSAHDRALAMKTCLYTNTPDNHFVIDRMPDHNRTILAAGFSGHGYKFCAGIGEILADLAIEGQTQQDLSLFQAGRLRATNA